MDPNTSGGFTRGSSVDLIWFQVGCPQSDFILRFNIRKIWIEKIGPLKLFVVLVPGLLCNFGWEVTIKIYYSTVSGGVTPIYIQYM
jgi:hypothetical protein